MVQNKVVTYLAADKLVLLEDGVATNPTVLLRSRLAQLNQDGWRVVSCASFTHSGASFVDMFLEKPVSGES